MSSRHIFDAAGSYRERTLTMSPGPSDTFKCGRCLNFCSITGRKLVSKDGNRRTYACAKCAVPK